jgi:XrtN system VIT domain protein
MTNMQNPTIPQPLARSTANNHGLGYILLLVSAGLFELFEWIYHGQEREDFGLFMLHYALALAYVVFLINKRAYGLARSWRRENLGATIILLNLFLISAYALNRSLPVFEDSTNWFCMYLVLTSVNLLSFQYFDKLPQWLNGIQYFVLGSSVILYLYLTLFVADIYIAGSIGIIAFGIGAHIFVPLTLLAASILIIVYNRRGPISFYWIPAGAVMTLAVVVTFVSLWNNRMKTIDRIMNQSVLESDASLPAWVAVAQSLPSDILSQKILKSGIVYTVASDKFNDWLFMPNSMSWEEARKHDPLIVIASMFSESTLTRDDKIRILQTRVDRHQAEARLWSGDNLSTTYVVSDIDLYPDLRLSYTEKYLTIKNGGPNQRSWPSTEEAIYTFQLPEGSVVTSLSLWINGKEEKAILTTKQKAKAAYDTIVGVMRRDPSVVHWQEGNTVSVRVFPCTPGEDRKFKIGITSPLIEEHGTITYKNIVFRGPDATNAKETVRVRVIGSASVAMPADFNKDKKGDYRVERAYDPDFRLSFPAVPLRSGNRFVFDGYEYAIGSYKPEFLQFPKAAIYLDINEAWTDKELDELKKLAGDENVSAYGDDQFISLRDDNWDEVVRQLQLRNFSLFPFHLLKDPGNSLVVTKGKPLSIQLSDLGDSEFADRLGKFFASGKKPYVYNLGTDVSTYIASMRELRGFQFAQGDIHALRDFINERKFPRTIENDNRVIMHDAQLVITKLALDPLQNNSSNAPDHLARLFAYNDIMRMVGSTYFKKDFINDSLIDEAASAYVVSPVSSLIVLESQKDYERFGIKDNENSLHNASKQSSGAVPEPHEWALIILFLLFILFLHYRSMKLKSA